MSFLALLGPVAPMRKPNCLLGNLLTYKNLIYLLNLQFCLSVCLYICVLAGLLRYYSLDLYENNEKMIQITYCLDK